MNQISSEDEPGAYNLLPNDLWHIIGAVRGSSGYKPKWNTVHEGKAQERILLRMQRNDSQLYVLQLAFISFPASWLLWLQRHFISIKSRLNLAQLLNGIFRIFSCGHVEAFVFLVFCSHSFLDECIERSVCLLKLDMSFVSWTQMRLK